MDNLEVKFYDTVNDELLKIAVIISQSNGKWVFCIHKRCCNTRLMRKKLWFCARLVTGI